MVVPERALDAEHDVVLAGSDLHDVHTEISSTGGDHGTDGGVDCRHAADHRDTPGVA
ncbi:hypothetical protein [Mycolicibacterium iranicum]|uniref:hypothetical protein n=1 Tax=Mycolicibacterium iranicum TaxID=912594 RepID=UPI0013A5BD2F|nr:hypothetical protein [Mycolicibacterium iranicum]